MPARRPKHSETLMTLINFLPRYLGEGKDVGTVLVVLLIWQIQSRLF